MSRDDLLNRRTTESARPYILGLLGLGAAVQGIWRVAVDRPVLGALLAGLVAVGVAVAAVRYLRRIRRGR